MIGISKLGNGLRRPRRQRVGSPFTSVARQVKSAQSGQRVQHFVEWRRESFLPDLCLNLSSLSIKHMMQKIDTKEDQKNE